MAPRTSRRDDGRRDGSNASDPTRRRLLGAVGATALAGLGGCIGRVLGQSSTEDDRAIRGSVEITFDHEVTSVPYGVPAAAYRAARDRDPTVPDAAAAAQTADVLDDLAARLLDRAGSPAAGVRAAQSLTASLPYATDAASTGHREYVRHPAETLVDGEGDCDDKAVLLSALLSRPAFDFRTGLVMPRNHCATLVARSDLPSGLVATPLTVTLDGTEFVYVEGVQPVPPGEAASDYGERPLLAAYRDRWHILDTGAVLNAAVTALDRGTAEVVTRYL
ncbi:hypothetical protein [Halorientalis pallida]|uniref:Transglutaminase-like superfamily protein n=1 Tax=Halorientalis pallida TaxID=2479928 RepID=A0A498KYG9_9EURY|nr:hypothetical protein [Halorientalis pallida]RXK50389.1 hypothetical protein EAF64_07495 [Halorientalis pallida]